MRQLMVFWCFLLSVDLLFRNVLSLVSSPFFRNDSPFFLEVGGVFFFFFFFFFFFCNIVKEKIFIHCVKC